MQSVKSVGDPFTAKWGSMKNAVRCDVDRSALQVPMKCTALANAVHCIFEWSALRQEELCGAEEDEASFPTDFTEETDSMESCFIITSSLSIRAFYVLLSSENHRHFLSSIRIALEAKACNPCYPRSSSLGESPFLPLPNPYNARSKSVKPVKSTGDPSWRGGLGCLWLSGGFYSAEAVHFHIICLSLHQENHRRE